MLWEERKETVWGQSWSWENRTGESSPKSLKNQSFLVLRVVETWNEVAAFYLLEAWPQAAEDPQPPKHSCTQVLHSEHINSKGIMDQKSLSPKHSILHSTPGIWPCPRGWGASVIMELALTTSLATSESHLNKLKYGGPSWEVVLHSGLEHKF